MKGPSPATLRLATRIFEAWTKGESLTPFAQASTTAWREAMSMSRRLGRAEGRIEQACGRPYDRADEDEITKPIEVPRALRAVQT